MNWAIALISARLLKPYCYLFPSRPANKATLCTGAIQYIDGFGNLITNIPAKSVSQNRWQITVKIASKEHRFSSIKTYSDVPTGTLSALVGSHGWIEIVCTGGSAAAMLQESGGIEVGTPVEMRFPSESS